MRVLLDTNIIIHREANRVINQDIGILFHWLDKLHYEKCIHPYSIDEIRKYQDQDVVKTFEAKIKNYNELKTICPDKPEIIKLGNQLDQTDNDKIDTSILSELYSNRVDYLISEDKKIHNKARQLGISQKVFYINSFLEKLTFENPEFKDYKVLSVKKEYFGNIDLSDTFFDTFKEDYPGYEKWFNGKANEIAYVCHSDQGKILAFLYLKIENEKENYYDIEPIFLPKRRLKIGTFKVINNGYKLGERFLKIIFDNALNFSVQEIYVTIFNKRPEQQSLITLLESLGFRHYGIKTSSGTEQVYVRDFSKKVNITEPRMTFPFISSNQNIFIIPIYPQYHTELFPDSILSTESPYNFVENEPHRNAIKKVYISRSIERNLCSGDLILFYRTKYNGPAYFTSVITTIGVVESINDNIKDENEFISLCRKRSVFSDNELKSHWNYNTRNKPFIVNFLYVYSFPIPRINLKQLTEYGIISQAPRGFERIEKSCFLILLEVTNAQRSFIVD